MLDRRALPRGQRPQLSVCDDVVALRERVELFEKGFEQSPIGMVLTNVDGTFNRPNLAFASLLGYGSPDELTGVSFASVTHPDDARGNVAAAREMAAPDSTYQTEKRYIRRDGRVVDVLLASTTICDVGGVPRMFFTQVEDITERKRAEKDRAQLAAILGSVASAVVRLSLDGRIETWNAGAERLYGYSAGEAIGQPAAILPASEPAARDALIATVAAGGPVLNVEVRDIRKDGTLIDVAVTDSPIRDADGQVVGIARIAGDITQRKHAERLRARLAAIVESSSDAIVSLRVDSVVETWNAGAQNLYGYTAAEAIGRHAPTLLAGAATARAAICEAVVTRGEVAQLESTDIRRDGSTVEVSVTYSPIRDSEGTVIGIARIGRDISERKAAEAESARLAAIIESSADAIVSLDSDGLIQTWNRGAQLLYGYGAAEATGRAISTLLSDDPSGREELLRTGASSVLRDVELTDLAKDGTPVHVAGTSSPIRDRDGRTTGVSIILRDISGRKRLEAERDRMELELQISQKLEAVGQLAAGIAHEINTPIQFIGDTAGFLGDALRQLEQLIDDYRAIIDDAHAPDVELNERLLAAEQNADLEYLRDRIPQALERMLGGIERVASIVQAMKAFGHTSNSEQQTPADINDALLTTLIVARNEYKYVAEVQTILGDLPPVTCNLDELNQVFLNLIVNAAHAIGQAKGDGEPLGTITIRTVAIDGIAVISIVDTGCGIPEELRSRVFDPFFTTKEVGRGTGQGLALARRIIERHHGSITLESEVGRGSTFTVKVPIDGDGATPNAHERPS